MMALSRSMKNLMHDAAQARRGGGSHNPDGGGVGRFGRAMQQQGGRGGMLSRVMQQARGRAGGGKPSPTGGGVGVLGRAMQQRGAPGGGGGGLRRAMERGGIMGGQYNPGPKLQPRGPMPDRGPRGPVVPGLGRRTNPMTGGAGGPVLSELPTRGGGMMRPAVQPPQRGPGTVVGKPMPRGGTFGFASRGGGGTPALQQATGGAMRQAMQQRAALGAGTQALAGGMSGAQQRSAMQRARAAGPAALAQPRGQTTAQRIGGRQGPPARAGGMARALGSGGSRRRLLR